MINLFCVRVSSKKLQNFSLYYEKSVALVFIKEFSYFNLEINFERNTRS